MPLFTSQTAAIAGRKGAIARWTPKPAPPEAPPQPPIAEEDPFHASRLARVRKQLDAVDRAIQDEADKAKPDGQRLNWLASAQERLAEQERQLAGRPLPGSLRPRAPRESRSTGSSVRPAWSAAPVAQAAQPAASPSIATPAPAAQPAPSTSAAEQPDLGAGI